MTVFSQRVKPGMGERVEKVFRSVKRREGNG